MNKKGFTLIEMVFVVSVILIIMLLVIPNVTNKHSLIKEKGCEAQLEVINAQIILYEIENGKLPSKISELYEGKNAYITKKQSICPNGKNIYIKDGQAYVE